MKYLMIGLGVLTMVAAFAPTEASAVVCARGVVRAGCVGPNGGAVAVRRPVPRAVVVAPVRGCRIVNGRRICRY